MRIGFDAKRIYQNTTGLGNYSRSLVGSLSALYRTNEYFLFAQKKTNLFKAEDFENIKTVFPGSFFYKKLPALWRTSAITSDIVKEKIELYHGLSFELPRGIEKTGAKSVVTVHDLIFERYPHQYAKADVVIHRKKTRHACKVADSIIAVSNQTKQDLIDFYNIDKSKIEICYQSCNPAFSVKATEQQKEAVRKAYNLPERFFLNVGSIIERKNLLLICKAIKELKSRLNIPLVVIGGSSEYKNIVEKYIIENGLQPDIIFLSDSPAAKNSPTFKSAQDFPAIYQMAEAMIYPSIFEGFGIPILEAMSGGTPVITTNVSCMPETAGNAALFTTPNSVETLAEQMYNIATNPQLVTQLKEKGLRQAEKFSPYNCAKAVMDVYKKLVQ